MNHSRRSLPAAALALAGLAAPLASHAESAAGLTAAGHRALSTLSAAEPRSRLFSRNARAVLVFPRIYKAGFVVGAQTSDGVLLEHGRAAGFYNISAGSFGLQAGGQA